MAILIYLIIDFFKLPVEGYACGREHFKEFPKI
jgi:hypothetical protein